jgi:hypothetical protein
MNIVVSVAYTVPKGWSDCGGGVSCEAETDRNPNYRFSEYKERTHLSAIRDVNTCRVFSV